MEENENIEIIDESQDNMQEILEESNNTENEEVVVQEEDEKKNSYEIVAGDGSELEISSVGEHLNAMRPKTQEEKTKKQIVIPEVKHSEDQVNSNN